MGAVALVISAILGSFFIYGFIYTVKQPSIYETGTVRLSKLPAFIGSVCGMLFLIPSVICAFEKDSDVYASIGFLAFSLLAAVLVVSYINTRITYDDTAFTYRGFLGRECRYDYCEITSLDVNVQDVTIRVGKKKISVDFLSYNYEDFLAKANKGYRHYHKKGIPPRDKKKDIFRGNIRGSDELVLGYIIGTVVIFATCIFIGVLPFVEEDETTTDLRETTFVSYSYKDDDLRFVATDGFEYELRNYDDSTDIASVISLCETGDSILVYCKEVDPKHGDNYFSIKAIKLGEETVLSFEETNRLHRKSNMFGIPFAIGFLIFWILTLVMTIIVGRNPTKYKKLVPLFFKGQYIR